MTAVNGKVFQCERCETTDTLLGTPGQTVTVERDCDGCGGKIKISFTFPKN